MLTLTGLRIAQQVAIHGSFTGAADALGYTQSAVSRQIAALEAIAGVSLFERHARGVRPTARGAVLLRHAAELLDRVAAAELELAGTQDRLEGRLVVGAFPTALAALVPRALARLAVEHPGVRVALREGPSPTHLRRLGGGRTEVAVVAAGAGMQLPEDLEVETLRTGELLVAVSAQHPHARRERIAVDELEGEQWIVGGPGESGPQFGPWPSLVGPPRVAYATRNWTARLGLVAAGLGVSVIPSLMAPALPANVRAVAVDDPRPLRRTLLVVTRKERSRQASAMVEALHWAAGAVERHPK